jgi:hypothetical protein
MNRWGGSEAINLARDLEKDSIPVLLTVQWIAFRFTTMIESSPRT